MKVEKRIRVVGKACLVKVLIKERTKEKSYQERDKSQGKSDFFKKMLLLQKEGAYSNEV